MVRWNKKICIEYLTTMRDPLEEASQAKPISEDPLQALIDMVTAQQGTQQAPQPISTRGNVNQNP